jgi:hypothetical protein
VDSLKDLEETPWANRNIDFSPNKLAWYLKPFDINSKQMRISGANKKGYLKEYFADAWSRYLPSGGDSAETAETTKLTHAYAPNETETSVNGNVSSNQQAQLMPDVSSVSFQSGDSGKADAEPEWKI